MGSCETNRAFFFQAARADGPARLDPFKLTRPVSVLISQLHGWAWAYQHFPGLAIWVLEDQAKKYTPEKRPKNREKMCPSYFVKYLPSY
jgi:hypothetical protein